MKRLRVPRSGGMIFGMFLALMGTCIMPVVFMAALAHSADQNPRPLSETLAELGRPIYDKVTQTIESFR
jgi:hypothetical protein